MENFGELQALPEVDGDAGIWSFGDKTADSDGREVRGDDIEVAIFLVSPSLGDLVVLKLEDPAYDDTGDDVRVVDNALVNVLGDEAELLALLANKGGKVVP